MENFDFNAETKIIADSCPVGLRTVLLQEHKEENPVIAYRIFSNRHRPQIDAALKAQNINRRRTCVRRLFEEIMIYNNY